MAAKKGKSVADAESQRLNVHISPDAHRRLGVHAIMAGVTPGRLVEKLINEHLREWKVQANPSGRGTVEDRRETAESVAPAIIPANI